MKLHTCSSTLRKRRLRCSHGPSMKYEDEALGVLPCSSRLDVSGERSADLECVEDSESSISSACVPPASAESAVLGSARGRRRRRRCAGRPTLHEQSGPLLRLWAVSGSMGLREE